jgi:hypothetical protein
MLVNNMAIRSILQPFRTFYGYFGILCGYLGILFSRFGKLYQEKSGKPAQQLERLASISIMDREGCHLIISSDSAGTGGTDILCLSSI